MSIEVQKQIKENATDISAYRTDLLRWMEEAEKQEARRSMRKGLPAGTKVPPRGPVGPTENEACAEAAMKAVAQAAGIDVDAIDDGQHEEEPAQPIKRDGQAMHQYYRNWDQFDVDNEVDKLDNEALDKQRREQQERQAEKDRILDELAINGEGDRTRTTKARPRVKIAVRKSGRRASPVDLAQPRRVEANGYFSSGRYREAVSTYSAALELLEKYEPPTEAKTAEDANKENEQTGGGDCAGQETEALELKTTLLANRAAAFLKLEEWRMVVEDCTEALRFNALHAKALLRRGFAYARMRRWAPAAKDLEKAVVSDPSDKKAAAELQMAKRMLKEQARSAREHAQRVLCDPTREAKLPTERLVVKVRRHGSQALAARQEEAKQIEAAGRRKEEGPIIEEITEDTKAKDPESSSTPPVTAAPKERKPFVPRAVRMRGGTSASSGIGVRADTQPQTMNFYVFESKWLSLRAKPQERLALLRKIGANALPALFRESFDAELLASIAKTLKIAEDLDTGFRLDVLAALVRTARFDLSFQALSEEERSTCFSLVEDLPDGTDPTIIRSIRDGFQEALQPLKDGYDEEEDEDDVAEAPPPFTEDRRKIANSTVPSKPTTEAAAAAAAEAEAEAAATTMTAPPAAVAAVAAVAAAAATAPTEEEPKQEEDNGQKKQQQEVKTPAPVARPLPPPAAAGVSSILAPDFSFDECD